MVRKIDAMLSFYLNIPNPETLSDGDYYDKWEQLLWVIEFDNKRKSSKEKELGI